MKRPIKPFLVEVKRSRVPSRTLASSFSFQDAATKALFSAGAASPTEQDVIVEPVHTSPPKHDVMSSEAGALKGRILPSLSPNIGVAKSNVDGPDAAAPKEEPVAAVGRTRPVLQERTRRMPRSDKRAIEVARLTNVPDTLPPTSAENTTVPAIVDTVAAVADPLVATHDIFGAESLKADAVEAAQRSSRGASKWAAGERWKRRLRHLRGM